MRRDFHILFHTSVILLILNGLFLEQCFLFSVICFVPLNIEEYSPRRCTRRNSTGRDRRELSEFHKKSITHTHFFHLSQA